MIHKIPFIKILIMMTLIASLIFCLNDYINAYFNTLRIEIPDTTADPGQLINTPTTISSSLSPQGVTYEVISFELEDSWDTNFIDDTCRSIILGSVVPSDWGLNSNKITIGLIKVGKDDGSGTGYEEGHLISLRLWHMSSGEEISLTGKSVSYFDMKRLSRRSPQVFEGLGSAVISIEVKQSAIDNVASVPADYRLIQNHPNPFNPTTKISHDLPEDCDGILEVYDFNGNIVKVL